MMLLSHKKFMRLITLLNEDIQWQNGICLEKKIVLCYYSTRLFQVRSKEPKRFHIVEKSKSSRALERWSGSMTRVHFFSFGIQCIKIRKKLTTGCTICLKGWNECFAGILAPGHVFAQAGGYFVQNDSKISQIRLIILYSESYTIIGHFCPKPFGLLLYIWSILNHFHCPAKALLLHLTLY